MEMLFINAWDDGKVVTFEFEIHESWFIYYLPSSHFWTENLTNQMRESNYSFYLLAITININWHAFISFDLLKKLISFTLQCERFVRNENKKWENYENNRFLIQIICVRLAFETIIVCTDGNNN